MLSKQESSELIVDLISNYSFTTSLKLNNKRQATRFRKRNPFYILFCLEISYDLSNNTPIPSELMVMQFDGDYCLSKFDRDLGKIVNIKGSLEFLNEVVTETMKKKVHGIYLNEITLGYRWKVYYGFNIPDSIINSPENLNMVERRRNEIYTFVNHNTIGFPDAKLFDLQEKYENLCKNAIYAKAGSVSRMQPLGFEKEDDDELKGIFDVNHYTDILGRFEYLTELDPHKINFPALFTSLDGVKHAMDEHNIAIVARNMINGVYHMKSVTAEMDAIEIKMVLVIGRNMETVTNDRNYFSDGLTCVYMRIFDITLGIYD